MIKWCAYCLRFLGEVPPFDDFQISHGVCPACVPRVLTYDAAELDAVQEVRLFFTSLQRSVRAGVPPDAEWLVGECRRLGIPPEDMMVGILQPLLVEVGRRWACGDLTPADEHRFTAMAEEVLVELRRALPAPREPARPRLVLVGAEGNRHTLGLQMAKLYLEAAGIPTVAMPQGPSPAGLMDLLARLRPGALGISVALPGQFAYVRAVAARLEGLPFRPRQLLAGGPAVRLELAPEPIPGVVMCRQMAEVAALLRASDLP